MPAVLSVIPFIVHLMMPVEPEFQFLFQFNYTAFPLTPKLPLNGNGVNQATDSISSTRLQFTDKLGGPGKLPVPLYAQLERSMTNRAIIYHQYRDQYNSLRKAYFLNENCTGHILLTTDVNKATVFKIRNENDELYGSNFDIRCYNPALDAWRKLTLVEGIGKNVGKRFEITVSPPVVATPHGMTGSPVPTPYDIGSGSSAVPGDMIQGPSSTSTAVQHSYALIGMITPYFMQNKL